MAREAIFTRHGESTANRQKIIANRIGDPYPLTEKGVSQADALGQKLLDLNLHISTIETSPLLRAVMTAGRVADKLGLDYRVSDALREPDCGELEGRGDNHAWIRHEELENEWLDGNDEYRIAGGESLSDVKKRFIPFVENVINKTQGDVLFVSHGSILIYMLPQLLSNIEPETARELSLPHCGLIISSVTRSGLRCESWCGVEVT